MGSASMVFQQKDAGDFDGLSARKFSPTTCRARETFQHRLDTTELQNTPANPAVAAAVTNPAATATGGVALGF